MPNVNGQHTPCFLDRYIEYADSKSPMTPQSFHEAIGLCLISITIARRLVAQLAHGDIFPNLWVLLVARTTLFAKTTAVNIARWILRRAVGHLLLPDASTPEAMLEILSGKNLDAEARDYAGQKGLIVDEMSGMLAQFGRDYMAGSMELLLRLYDSLDEYERVTRGQGRVKVTGAYFTMLAASTPTMLARFLKPGHMWANGWWPRFGIIPQPETRPPYRESQISGPDIENGLISTLQALHSRLPRSVHGQLPTALRVAISSDVMGEYKVFDKRMRYELQTEQLDERLSAVYGRTPTTAMKIAICLAAIDWSETAPVPCIEMHHWRRAESIAHSWALGAERTIHLAEAHSTDERIDKVRRAVANHPGWNSIRDIYRATGLKASEVEMMIAELVGVGEVETHEISKNGRTVTEARWADVVTDNNVKVGVTHGQVQDG